MVLVLEHYSMLGFWGKLRMLNLYWLNALHVTSTRVTRRAVALDAFSFVDSPIVYTVHPEERQIRLFIMPPRRSTRSASVQPAAPAADPKPPSSKRKRSQPAEIVEVVIEQENVKPISRTRRSTSTAPASKRAPSSRKKSLEEVPEGDGEEEEEELPPVKKARPSLGSGEEEEEEDEDNYT